jgi:hypothetical protein
LAVIAIALILVISVFGLPSLAAPGEASSEEALLTTSLTVVNASRVTEYGYQGISITYNNTLPQQETLLAFVSVQNSLGNTVYISVLQSSVPSKQDATFFFGLVGLGSANYTARLFATNQQGVPISTTTTLRVSL